MGCQFCTDSKSNLQTVSTRSEGLNRSQKLIIATEIDPLSLFQKLKIPRDFTDIEKHSYQTHSRVLFYHQEMRIDSMKCQSVATALREEGLQNVYLA
jgi:hypothetical protein